MPSFYFAVGYTLNSLPQMPGYQPSPAHICLPESSLPGQRMTESTIRHTYIGENRGIFEQPPPAFAPKASDGVLSA